MADTKMQDIEVDKKPAIIDNDDVEADLKAGTISDLDEAEIFLRDHGIAHSRLHELMSDENALKKLRRKVDWTLMPLLCGTYLLQYIDKQALGYSAVFDLFTSTGMTSDQYSWMASIFYFAYLVAEWPASYLAQRLPTGTVVSSFVITWGTILCLTAACQNFAGLAVCRFLLGTFEAVITPAFMLIVSQWFRAKGWDVWRIIYVLCGGLTVCWGILLFFYLPNNILTAKRFTVEERAMLIAQSARNRTGVFNRKIKWNQIKEVFCDSQIWLLFFFTLLNEVINGGIANFSKLIVKGFTKDPLLTTAYGIPYGACMVVFDFTGPYLASRFKNVRTIVMIVWLMPTLVAVTLFWQLPRTNKGGLLAGYYICASFVGALVVALQMPASNVGGYTKRTTATAFVFLAYCIGNIIGPHGFLGSEAPIYQTGCKLIIGCVAGQVLIALILRYVLIRRNKLRDAQGPVIEDENAALQDLTDFENPNFRYAY
ncbi:hypothetical protein CDV31_004424 [Fusarium ambrosium]|uniref:Major facilitator superfamily (MFS) profile domain-containing protein n=1 Tax=Fusarium ambrosium TaxID=131363 RepID=A0A428URB2_9HYPO|nr:hypothetical protein CDV31_004424 [Fusarium ambrosium]